jgi:fluoride exporter
MSFEPNQRSTRLAKTIAARPTMSTEQLPTVRQPVFGRKLAIGAAAFSAAIGLAIGLADSIGAYTAIGIGSALGGIGRYWCSGVAARLIGETFPWGTLIVNVVGSFVIGFFGALCGPDGRMFVGTTARQFVMVGICGGYTTFSSFSLQTLALMNDGEWLQAGANIALSVVLCLLAVWAGQSVAIALTGLRSA